MNLSQSVMYGALVGLGSFMGAMLGMSASGPIPASTVQFEAPIFLAAGALAAVALNIWQRLRAK